MLLHQSDSFSPLPAHIFNRGSKMQPGNKKDRQHYQPLLYFHLLWDRGSSPSSDMYCAWEEIAAHSLSIVLGLNSKDLLLTPGLLLTIPLTLYISKNINAGQKCKIYLHYKTGVHLMKAKIANGNCTYNSRFSNKSLQCILLSTFFVLKKLEEQKKVVKIV